MYGCSVSSASYALAILLTKGADRQQRLQSWAWKSCAHCVVLGGGVLLPSLGAARVRGEHAEHDGLTALALQRGFSEGAALRARTLATAQRIARLIGLPALLLVALGLARGATLGWATSCDRSRSPGLRVPAGPRARGVSRARSRACPAPSTCPAARARAVSSVLFSQAYSAIPSLPGRSRRRSPSSSVREL